MSEIDKADKVRGGEDLLLVESQDKKSEDQESKDDSVPWRVYAAHRYMKIYISNYTAG